MKIIFCIITVVPLLLMVFSPMVSIGYGRPPEHPPEIDWTFRLPSWGGGMVHCTPQMTDNIRLPVPMSNVGIAWYQHSLGGELFGTWGNGIAGNGRIAASTFTNYFGIDNLIIYDYDGNYIWHSDSLLNCLATASTPMVDIHDRVVACDNEKVILVNASDHNNVYVEWNSTMPHDDLHPLQSVVFSPSIVENRTIILPTRGGPLLAYDVQTGQKIAEIRLGQNRTSEPYYGIPDMSMSDFLSITSDPLVCPYHYNSENNIVEWVSTIPYGIMPDYLFYEDNIVFMSNSDGMVSAIDNTTGVVLASNSIGTLQLLPDSDYYSTINSACVKGNRIYLACEQKGNGNGSIIAVDVNPDAANKTDILTEEWYFDYPGKSQATPTLIGDTIYFDGYNKTLLPSQDKDPHIYAVYIENGTEKWSVQYPFMTWFSFTMDPRGGFWYEESGIFGDNGKNLTHFYEENGTIKEIIDIPSLIDDTGPYKDFPLFPCSCMTMCGTETRPIMIVSANHRAWIPGKWVVAIDVVNNNEVLWKIRLDSVLAHSNYANGQYTILRNDGESRILFGTWLGGVMAIGTVDQYPPNTPDTPSGPVIGKINTSYTYLTRTIDPDDDQVYYWWDWGDGTNTGWLGPYNSGETVRATHSWSNWGLYTIWVKAKDIHSIESDWSNPHLLLLPHVPSPTCFLEGTRIAMADRSYKNIEDAQIGDLVKSYDDVNKKEITGVVTKTLRHAPDEMTDYYVVVNNKLRVTPNHCIYVDGSWVPAGNLAINDKVSTSKIAVRSIQKVYTQVQTYDLVVQPVGMQTLVIGGVIPSTQQDSVPSQSLPYFADDILVKKIPVDSFMTWDQLLIPT